MELTAGFFQAVWAPALVPLQDVSHTDSMPRMGAHPWAPERESLRARRCRRDPREWMLSWEHPEAFRSEVKSHMRKSLSKTCCIARGTPLQAVCHPGWQEGLGRMGTCICTAESLRCLPETITASLNSSVNVAVVSTQSCPALCKPRDCSPPGSSVHGILQARILEWVATPFSRGSSKPRD